MENVIENIIRLFRLHTLLNGKVLYHLLTPWSSMLLEKLIGSQLVKKFPVFYGTQKFITVPFLNQIDPVHALTSHFLNILLNTIIPPTPGSSK